MINWLAILPVGPRILKGMLDPATNHQAGSAHVHVLAHINLIDKPRANELTVSGSNVSARHITYGKPQTPK